MVFLSGIRKMCLSLHKEKGYKISFILLFISFALPSFAQRDTLWLINTTSSIGVGQASLYDTYLSPLKYTGKSITLNHERISRTHLVRHETYKQIVVQLEGAQGYSPSRNGKTYSLIGGVRLGFHRQSIVSPSTKIRWGIVSSLEGGVIYNDRNSNNPANGKIATNIHLSGMIIRPLWGSLLRFQVDIPTLGVFFSPNYTESYYEIWKGNRDGVLYLASFHNQRGLRSLLSVDIPVNKWAIRLSLQSSLLQTKQNDLQHHLYTHTFLVGVSNESFRLPFRKKKVISTRESSVFKSPLW